MYNSGHWDRLFGNVDRGDNVKPTLLEKFDEQNMVSHSALDFEFPYKTGRPPACNLLLAHTLRKDHDETAVLASASIQHGT